MQSILVTGGAGFIGHHLVKRLLQGCRVVIIDNLSSGKGTNIPKHQNVVFYKEDIRNKEIVADIVKKERVDTCVHLAAKTSVSESLAGSDVMDVNANGTASVLEACSQAGVGRFVFASSAAVYGEALIQPVHEDSELKPISPYGESKVQGEKLALSFQKSGKIPRTIALRFFNVYGEGQNPHYAGVITKFAERLSKGLPPVIYGDGRQTRDFVSVNDVIDAIELTMQSINISADVFNIGTGCAISINELAREMTEIFGMNLNAIYQKANPGEIIHSHADTRKAAEKMKFLVHYERKTALKLLFEITAKRG